MGLIVFETLELEGPLFKTGGDRFRRAKDFPDAGQTLCTAAYDGPDGGSGRFFSPASMMLFHVRWAGTNLYCHSGVSGGASRCTEWGIVHQYYHNEPRRRWNRRESSWRRCSPIPIPRNLRKRVRVDPEGRSGVPGCWVLSRRFQSVGSGL